jgi:histidinol-phosphate aminotransferase
MNPKDMEKSVRKNILSLTPYSTARDECGMDAEVYLDANENPYDNGFNRYPDPHQKLLKRKISEKKGIPEDMIFIGNGSDEAIDLVFRIFCRPGIDNAVSIAPTYGMYKVAAAINDVEFREVPLRDDFSLDCKALTDAADSNTRLMFICSPNNPTGNSFPMEEILKIAGSFDGIVVLDEAYIDFSSLPSLAPMTASVQNLIVLQTFSKAWGMAGLRVGMAFAAPWIIRLMSNIKYPYNINSITQKIVMQRLRERIFYRGLIAGFNEQLLTICFKKFIKSHWIHEH